MLSHVMTRAIDNTLRQIMNNFDAISVNQTVSYAYCNHIENPSSIMKWCDVEGYDSYQMARSAGYGHYDLTHMPV